MSMAFNTRFGFYSVFFKIEIICEWLNCAAQRGNILSQGGGGKNNYTKRLDIYLSDESR
jgi:hypothetical protein